MASEQAMTLRDHLEELRRRLTITAVFVVATTAAAFAFRDRLLAWLLRPGFDQVDFKPVYTEVAELVGVVMKVAFTAGLVFAMPVVLLQVVLFIAPALTRQEKTYLYLMLPGTLLAFLGGVLFGYYVIFPPAFNFLFTFEAEYADPTIRISSYINVLTMMMFWMGVVFELPVVMFLLARVGVLTPRMLHRFRRFAYVLAFVVGAIITPTFDPVNQALVAVPVIVLYELGIGLAWVGQRLRGATPAAAKVPARR
ncbi:MAG: twin-arginine translocase subunit TatC [SAR202 cluster bacterium]|nr:twin-arginine translocase subunit TatC [SAR202 cluster bacterium]